MMLRYQDLLHYHVKLRNHLMLLYPKEMRMKRMNWKQVREHHSHMGMKMETPYCRALVGGSLPNQKPHQNPG